MDHHIKYARHNYINSFMVAVSILTIRKSRPFCGCVRIVDCNSFVIIIIAPFEKGRYYLIWLVFRHGFLFTKNIFKQPYPIVISLMACYSFLRRLPDMQTLLQRPNDYNHNYIYPAMKNSILFL